MDYNTALEGATTNYPDSPGYRSNAPETSREAAEAIAPMARNHRAQVLAVLKDAPGKPQFGPDRLRDRVEPVQRSAARE